MDKQFRKPPAEEPQIEDDLNNVSTSQQQENGSVDIFNSQGELFVSHMVRATLKNKHTDGNLIISDKKSAKNIQNYLTGYLKLGFIVTIFNNKLHVMCTSFFEI